MKEKVIEILAGINDEILTLAEGDNLIEMEIFDSLDIIEMIERLEKEFQITINPDEIGLRNIDTIGNIVKLLEKKLQ